MIYEDIEKQVTFYINKGNMIKYLMSKNKHWDDKIFEMIDW